MAHVSRVDVEHRTRPQHHARVSLRKTQTPGTKRGNTYRLTVSESPTTQRCLLGRVIATNAHCKRVFM
jgi:hypothetical protein